MELEGKRSKESSSYDSGSLGSLSKLSFLFRGINKAYNEREKDNGLRNEMALVRAKVRVTIRLSFFRG